VSTPLLDYRPPEEPEEPLPLAPLRPEVVDALCQVASTLAAIQIPDQTDLIGFSNADVSLGSVLVATIRADPSDEESVRALAGLVGYKYARQASGYAPPEMLNAFRAIASERKVSLATRKRARGLVIVESANDGTATFIVQGTAQIRATFEKYRGTVVTTADGREVTAVPLGYAAGLLDALARDGATLVGKDKIPDLIIIPRERMRGVKTNIISLHRVEEPDMALLTFDYHRNPETGSSDFADTIKTLPYSDRSYSPIYKGWLVRDAQIGVLATRLEKVGADVTQLVHFAEQRGLAIPGGGGAVERGPYIRVEVEGNLAKIATIPYNETIKNAILSLSTRTWDRDSKVWKVPMQCIVSLDEALRNIQNVDMRELHAAAKIARDMSFEVARFGPIEPSGFLL
jgi:hypothetical protein